MKAWQVQDAKARFSELLDTCLAEGPQMVTRRGEGKAVLVSLDQWEQLQARGAHTIKDWLMTDFARGELNIPPRGRMRRRPPVVFDD